jgi:N-methylhydantoinase A/oxoprolinase/acetone carboxylase beta subunit
MQAVGIDVGGTYTDGVLVDLPGRKVLRTAKVPTVKDDLEGSVLRCFSSLAVQSPSLLSRFCVSTTLATNAMVEGTKRDVCAICIGLVPRRAAEYASETVIIDGGHDAMGLEVHPLDLPAVREGVSRTSKNTFAISARFGSRNPEHEIAAAKVVLEAHPEATVVRGSDLTGTLGMEERLFLAAKNAELVHVMRGLIRAIGAVTRVPDSSVYVLKGDGSLVSTEEAALRPIMTVLSGPAASATGGALLARVRDALVIDIGGTTTDIALLDGGRVRLSEEGASGRRGEAQGPIGRCHHHRAGRRYRDLLRRWTAPARPTGGAAAVPVLRRSPADAGPVVPLPDRQEGERRHPHRPVQGRGEERVRRRECCHVRPRCHGQRVRHVFRELFTALEEAIRIRLLMALSAALTGQALAEGGDAETLLRGNRLFRPVLSIDIPIVGIGAPARPFLDLLAGRVSCEIIVPEHHEVGNAVGAACTGVFGRRELVVRCEPRLVQGEEAISLPRHHRRRPECVLRSR